MDHDHLPALTALLFAAPLAFLALAGAQLAARLGYGPAGRALARASDAPAPARLAALLLLIGGAVHAGLVPGHADEPVFAVAFAAAAVTLVAVAGAAIVALPWWRPVAAALMVALPVSYLATRLAGVEGTDALGVSTAIVEVAALAAVLCASGQPVCPRLRTIFARL